MATLPESLAKDKSGDREETASDVRPLSRNKAVEQETTEKTEK